MGFHFQERDYLKEIIITFISTRQENAEINLTKKKYYLHNYGTNKYEH